MVICSFNFICAILNVITITLLYRTIHVIDGEFIVKEEGYAVCLYRIDEELKYYKNIMLKVEQEKKL